MGAYPFRSHAEKARAFAAMSGRDCQALPCDDWSGAQQSSDSNLRSSAGNREQGVPPDCSPASPREILQEGGFSLQEGTLSKAGKSALVKEHMSGPWRSASRGRTLRKEPIRGSWTQPTRRLLPLRSLGSEPLDGQRYLQREGGSWPSSSIKASCPCRTFLSSFYHWALKGEQ